MEHESHHHHPHGTGVRWLDIILGVSATIVSLVSLWLGLHSAHSMEKLVAANSYPYLELMRSTKSTMQFPGSDRPRAAIEYEMVNNGIGPARIEWVELQFKDKPVRNLAALLDACCAGWKNENTPTLNLRNGINGALVRAGSSVKMFTWTEPDTPSATFTALHQQMDEIKYSACYCSVFDECYVQRSDEKNKKPEPVKQCQAPAITFQPSFVNG